ncbi:MAG: hypothetical protein AAGF89_05920 [Bacteroidota bacterium]
MKYLFLFLLSIALFACDKEEEVKKELLPEASDTFIIGHTGGWGGGPAYKLEDGQLFRSVKDRFLGEPADIVDDLEYALVADADDLISVSDLVADFPAATFDGQPTKFSCPEAAYDGMCPYLIVVEKSNTFKVWTLSEQDDASPTDDYLERVSNLLIDLWE